MNLEPTPPPSCPYCGLNDAVTKENTPRLGWHWYCTGPCGASVFFGGDDEWRRLEQSRHRLRNRLEIA